MSLREADYNQEGVALLATRIGRSRMRRVQDIMTFLEQFAPLQLAESWDNVGLLLGDRERTVSRVMTCLTLTPDVAEEAVDDKAQLIVCHHPILFRAVKRLTSDTDEGRMLLQLMESRIAVYSPHTAFDSAAEGINASIAAGLKLEEVRPLRPHAIDPEGAVGGGRCGRLAMPIALRELIARAKKLLSAPAAKVVGDLNYPVQSVAIACGSGAEFLPDAVRAGCDVLITGEARFHACLEARSGPTALVLLGHYATERPGVERLAIQIAEKFAKITCWPSRKETDPVRWVG